MAATKPINDKSPLLPSEADSPAVKHPYLAGADDAPHKVAEDRYALHDDPFTKGLTKGQKEKIRAFVDGYLKGVFFTEEPSSTTKSVLSKTYCTTLPNTVAAVRRKIDQSHKGTTKSYDAFRRAFLNPQEIDPTLDDPKSLFAAHRYMKCAIRAHFVQNLDPDAEYFRKMTAGKQRSLRFRDESEVSGEKNRMIMAMDPVQKLDTSKPFTALDIVLANTHFEWNPDVYLPKLPTDLNREQARGRIKEIITDLWRSPETRHVIEALGTLMLREKGNIFIGNFNDAEEMALDYGVRDAKGFYGNRHSIMIPSLLRFASDQVDHENVGTFVHESLHMLFNRLVRNRSSPVRDNSDMQVMLDQALEADRAHRKRKEYQTRHLQNVWKSIVEGLENDTRVYFFPDGFDPKKPQHLHTMRVEAIVRIMEQVAEGVPLDEIRKVAPNLCKFYMEHSKLFLEAYVRENAHLFQAPVLASSVPGVPAVLQQPPPQWPVPQEEPCWCKPLCWLIEQIGRLVRCLFPCLRPASET